MLISAFIFLFSDSNASKMLMLSYKHNQGVAANENANHTKSAGTKNR